MTQAYAFGPLFYFGAYHADLPYPAKLVSITRQVRGEIVVELLGGPRDGERIQCIGHDAAGNDAHTWCCQNEYKPAK